MTVEDFLDEEASASRSSEPETDPAPQAPPPSIGRYQLGPLLGAGGMGQVFAALDLQLGRAVALKLVRPEGRLPSSRARTRLLREAQALARLTHPNVVAVHDVGTAGDEVFIAMELVDGPTLREWLAAAPRPWRAVRDVFVSAGRGLVAAHAAGTVHRDFKPSNVIVGQSRVVVIDFGLACTEGSRDEPALTGVSSTLDLDLTFTGERVGTLRYMAPEQHAGRAVTAQADQFAFAASLWEALFGASPFPGRGSAAVMHRMASGPPVPPASVRVPDHVRAALQRALSFKPEDRWPALGQLLDELVRDPEAKRRRFLGTFAIAFVGLSAPVTILASSSTAPAATRSCAAPAPGLWDEQARGDVRAAFLASGRPSAGDDFERLDAGLRARVDLWSRQHEEACAATEIRHEQSAARMDLRMGCLARARQEIAAFVDVLRAADAGVVERAAAAAAVAGDIEACGDGEALGSGPPPRDPAAVAAADRELARVAALAGVGRPGEALAAGTMLVERARALAYPPLVVRALSTVGGLACDAGEARRGTPLLHEAARAAAAARDDLATARIATTLVSCAGGQLEVARALAETAEAALLRAGNPPDLRARLDREERRLQAAGFRLQQEPKLSSDL